MEIMNLWLVGATLGQDAQGLSSTGEVGMWSEPGFANFSCFVLIKQSFLKGLLGITVLLFF